MLAGDPPGAIHPPSGRPFRTRRRYAQPAGEEAVPPLREVPARHFNTCRRDDLPLQETK